MSSEARDSTHDLMRQVPLCVVKGPSCEHTQGWATYST